MCGCLGIGEHMSLIRVPKGLFKLAAADVSCRLVLPLLVFPDSCDCLLILNQLVPDLRLDATCPDLGLALDYPSVSAPVLLTFLC
ncbi:unnamed protein product [Staurois parvus]|uniref:Uncharacterized protein n=1 Tax=Staurois parvus TaxID=386267 RepID=A0ABN9F0V4_9NEOB|nr:unnamed protein product [Staurois parvus]